MKKTIIVCCAMISLTILAMSACRAGINGVLMSAILAVIAGLAGLTIPTPKVLKV